MEDHNPKRESVKQSWLITYGSGCKSIDHEMLSTFGLYANECYTATWRESKYTLFHLPRQHAVRHTGVARAMVRMKDVHGILGTEIFGFEVLACNSKSKNESIEQHPGFKIMVEMLNKEPGKLEVWMTADRDIRNNRKGLLWKYIEDTDAGSMTRAQLVHRVSEWSPMVKEYEATKQQNALLIRRLENLEGHVSQLKTQNQALTSKLHEADKALREERKGHDTTANRWMAQIDECNKLRSRLRQNTHGQPAV